MPDELNGDEPLVTATGLTDLLGMTNVRALDPRTTWRTRPPRDLLRVAIGVGTTGQAVELDLKEAAQGGMGPHGLVIGATGSGKSELLRTLVLGLAMTHSPESLNFVLVDFKGGATFARLDALPHTSAVITNLSDELTLVDRMKDAISGEMHRRMEILRRAGHFASLRDYENARATGDLTGDSSRPPQIPTLLIVVDEFSELLSAKPDFLDLFITIGRVGRSLGVHLLLASQRLEEGRLRGLDTYLSYRIGLKTFSVAESRIVLGVPDAFELPTAPGNGYLKFDTGSLLRFKAAYVSGPVREEAPCRDGRTWVDAEHFRLTLPASPDRAGAASARPGRAGAASARPGRARPGRARPGGAAGPGAVGVDAPASDALRSGQLLNGSSPFPPAATDSAVKDRSDRRSQAGDPRWVPTPTVLDIAVSRLTGSGMPAREVWLPPLLEPPSLDLLLAGTESSRTTEQAAAQSPAAVAAVAAAGAVAAVAAVAAVEMPSHPTAFGAAAAGKATGEGTWSQPTLSVPIGWVDRPFEQRRGVLALDLSGSGGHVAIVGAPQTGKSTAVRSLVCALALTQPPDQVQVYCLDFGGGSLTALSGLPHVGVVAGRAQPDLVRRTVGMVDRIMSGREETFATHSIGSLREWRERTESGQVPGDGFGDVFLVVDGWGGVRDSFEPLESQLISMAARGLNFGVHLVLSATRWSEIRPALKDLVSSRVELRLGDPLDSDINSKAATNVPTDRPGRGLTRDQQHLLTAVPRIDGMTSAEGLPSATAKLVDTVAERWPDHAAPEVRLLPSVLRAADLPAVDADRGYVLGLDEDFGPVYWSPRADQHLLIFGEEESGRTTLLANLLRQISARTSTDQARFIIFDGRRQLLDLAYRVDQMIASATTAQDAANVVSANVERLHRRMPVATASAEEIGRRGWWGSPADIFLVVDDYERFAGSSPLVPLLPLLDHAGDIGLHLIIARQARGASRAMYDGVYTRLRDAGSPAVVLSAPEPEGVIYGKSRAQPRPPGRGVWVPRRGPDRIIQATIDCGITNGS
jgi:S-DNA-T family DNA segregation ATPase FtsK/SpoIIIE